MEKTNNIPQQLLNDLEQFIGVILRKETLSRSAEKCRSQLHDRLQPYAVKVETEDVEEQFEDAVLVRPCSQMSITSMKSDELKITYSFLEVREMKTKCGPLWRKEKGILRVGWRKYMAGLCAHYLVLYYTERDLKPIICLNIQSYVARPAPNTQKDQMKKGMTFEIVCPGKRDYQFFARTVKDMKQWVASICQASIQNIDNLFTSSIQHIKTTATTNNETENYDDGSSSGSVMFDEDYYDDIAESKISNSKPDTKSVLNTPDADVEEIYNDIDESEQLIPIESVPSLPIRSIGNINNDDKEEFYNDIEEPAEPLQIGKKSLDKRPLLPPPDSRNEEFYNDIEEFDKPAPKSTVKIIEKRPPLPPPAPPEDDPDEIYHDISDYQKLPLPKPIIQTVTNQNPPPLPARRPLPSIPREDSIEVEETYDDVGCSSPSEQSRYVPSTLKTDISTEQEEIYDDVDTSSPVSTETHKGVSTNQGSKVLVELSKKDATIKKKETSVSHRNKSTEVLIDTKETKNDSVIENKIPEQYNRDKPTHTKHLGTNEGLNKSFLQRQYLDKNAALINFNKANNQLKSQNEVSIQNDEIHENKQTNISRNEVSSVQSLNVKDITSKFNQQKNNSFLYRTSSHDDDESLVEWSKLKTAKPFVTKPREKFDTKFETSEKDGEHFQSALKKIESSLLSRNKSPINQYLAQNLNNRNNPNEMSMASNHALPKHKSPMSDLQNKPKQSPSSKPPVPGMSLKMADFSSKNKVNTVLTSHSSSNTTELPSRNIKHSLFPASNSASSDSSTTLTKSKPLSQPFSNAPSVPTSRRPALKTKPNIPITTPFNTMPNKSTLATRTNMSSSEHQKQFKTGQEPLPNGSKTSLSDLTLNTSNNFSSQSRNKPNVIPVTIPNVPPSPTLSIPKLPPRPHLK